METLRPKLKPSTVETIRGQLEFQRSQHPGWIAYHFPEIDGSGMPVDYEDIDQMTEREADSVRHLLLGSIVYGRQRIRKLRANSMALFNGTTDGGDDSDWSIRVRQFEEALSDLCAAFGLTARN